MSSNLTDNIREYLRVVGVSEKRIARLNLETRLYHDLGFYGDVAEGYMEVLMDHFHVDLRGFDFYKYFPPEITGKICWNKFFFDSSLSLP